MDLASNVPTNPDTRVREAGHADAEGVPGETGTASQFFPEAEKSGQKVTCKVNN
jgi:hypothetical protein